MQCTRGFTLNHLPDHFKRRVRQSRQLEWNVQSKVAVAAVAVARATFVARILSADAFVRVYCESFQ